VPLVVSMNTVCGAWGPSPARGSTHPRASPPLAVVRAVGLALGRRFVHGEGRHHNCVRGVRQPPRRDSLRLVQPRVPLAHARTRPTTVGARSR
jgi:hypothetical protein